MALRLTFLRGVLSIFMRKVFCFSNLESSEYGGNSAEDEDRKYCYLGVRLRGRGHPWLCPFWDYFQALGMHGFGGEEA